MSSPATAPEPASAPAALAPAPALHAAQVARFLQQQPDFFQQYADLFAHLNVPHPYAQTTLSLGQRQVLTLRDKVKDLEQTLAQLMHQARRNEHIARKLMQYSARLLQEDRAARLPHTILTSLKDVFDLPAAALKLWGLWNMEANAVEGITDDVARYALPADARVPQMVQALQVPYCGPVHSAGEPWAAWLAQWFDTLPASIAMVALRPPPAAEKEATHDGEKKDAAPALGVMVIGASKPDRFSADMQTAFLADLGQLTGAALSRLNPDRVHPDRLNPLHAAAPDA